MRLLIILVKVRYLLNFYDYYLAKIELKYFVWFQSFELSYKVEVKIYVYKTLTLRRVQNDSRYLQIAEASCRFLRGLSRSLSTTMSDKATVIPPPVKG